MADVKYTFDPFELAGISRRGVSSEKREEVMSRVADYVKESVLNDVGNTRSPVTGRKFKGLSTKGKDGGYRAQKARQGGTPVPNLELDGAMLGSLEVEQGERRLTLTVGSDQQDKADGHNNFSGKSKLPERKFIPNAADDETFRPAIRDGIKQIIDTVIEEE